VSEPFHDLFWGEKRRVHRPARFLFCKAPVRQPIASLTRVRRGLERRPGWLQPLKTSWLKHSNRVDHASCLPLPLVRTVTLTFTPCTHVQDETHLHMMLQPSSTSGSSSFS